MNNNHVQSSSIRLAQFHSKEESNSLSSLASFVPLRLVTTRTPATTHTAAATGMSTSGKLVSSVVRLTLLFGAFVNGGGAVTWTVKLSVLARIPPLGDMTAVITAAPGAVGWKIAVEVP
jgi:hypothetical protein